MNDTLIIIGTIVIVAIVVIVCHVVDTRVNSYLKKYSDSRDSEEAKTIAKVAANASTAFEEALKKSFNEAIADGVITKEEAIKIITDTFTAVKNEFIDTSKDLINKEKAEKDLNAEELLEEEV
jgi:hypothetical protein